MVHKQKGRLVENIYSGSYRQLLRDKNAIDTILRWEDESQVETNDGVFTVRYIKTKLGY
jgi:hypothetical protein